VGRAGRILRRKNGPVAEQLAQAAPEGIDVFFDNVGGEHLEAAIGALKLHARIVLSGMVSQYNDETVVGPRNLWNMSVTRSKLLAFMVTEELDLQPDFIREVGGWAAAGKLQWQAPRWARRLASAYRSPSSRNSSRDCR
jgi:NADPH-dependent curcumin reductase CurA